MNILLGMRIRCTGNVSAKVSGILVRSEDRVVTHLLVKQGQTERMLRIGQVANVVDNVLVVDESALDLGALPLFVQMQYFRTPVLHYDVVPGAYGLIEHTEMCGGSIMSRSIPDGVEILRRSSVIYALDGYVGHLSSTFIDPETGEITAIGVRKGRLWNVTQIFLPADLVSVITDGTLHLARRLVDMEQITV